MEGKPEDIGFPDLSGRRFLLLQGPQSQFFRRLQKRLLKTGASVQKVNFCGGDVFLWGFAKAHWYLGNLYKWPEWIGSLFSREGITDICLYGDWRPMHWEAVRLARVRGIRIWVFEEGYLRTWFSTLEEVGVNGRSLLPRDPEQIRRIGESIEVKPVIEVKNTLEAKVSEAVWHHTGNFFLFPVFFRYRTHRPTWIGKELPGLLRRLHNRKERVALSAVVWETFQKEGTPYFFFPLQLSSDSQIRLYSPYVGTNESIGSVLASFAKGAPADARLLIKNHPLDNGLFNYQTFIRGFARELGIEDRVTFVEEGSTYDMIAGCQGVVLVNSTVGFMALEQGKPVYCLGRSIYDIPGLTASARRRSLDNFWKAPEKPDMELFEAYTKLLRQRALIRGSFYSSMAQRVAAMDTLWRFANPFDPEWKND